MSKKPKNLDKSGSNLGIQIRDLEYLVVLSRLNHFGRTAEECKVSQPTISGQVRKLEELLGIRLVERSSRKVLFTKSGLTLVEQSRKILNNIRILKEMALQLRNDMSGSLHIGLIPTLGPYISYDLLNAFAESYPNLDIYLYEKHTNDLIVDLELGQIDFAILAKVPEAEDFSLIPLVDEPIKLLVNENHPLANSPNGEISLDDLSGHKVFLLNEAHCMRGQTTNICAMHNIMEDSRFMTSSLETLRFMVRGNIGITFMPYTSVRDPKLNEGLKILNLTPEPTRHLEIAYRPASPLKARYATCAKLIRETLENIINANVAIEKLKNKSK